MTFNHFRIIRLRFNSVFRNICTRSEAGATSPPKFLSKFNITSDNFALMSIDIDSYDYYVFNSIEKYFPKVLILEVSSGYLPARDHISESDGCSIKSAYELGIEKGYKMVCHCGNVIFVRDDLVNKLPDYDYSIENLYQTPDDLKKWEVGE